MKYKYNKMLNSFLKNYKANRNANENVVYCSPLTSSLAAWLTCIVFGVGLLGSLIIILACIGTVLAEYNSSREEASSE
jgi:hypothetical protein